MLAQNNLHTVAINTSFFQKEVDAPSRKLLRRLVKLSEEAVDGTQGSFV